MEQLIEKAVQKCLQADLIDEDQTEWLLYWMQCRLINAGGFAILICLGLFFAPLPQVLLLNVGLAFLRAKTNGLHMPTKASCFAFSLLWEYGCLYVIHQMQGAAAGVPAALLLVSSVLIWRLSPCNNAAIHYTRDELGKARKAVHIRLVFYILTALILLAFNRSLANTWIVAEAAAASLVVLAKLGFGVQ